MSEMQRKTSTNKDIHDVNFHRFMELHDHTNHMEMAMELGITLGEVNQLKKKVNRT